VLLWNAAHPNTPAAFAVHPHAIGVVEGSYRAPVTVQNTGDESAKSLVVHLELVAAYSTLAESDVTIDWLPGNSSRDLVGVFARRPTGPAPTAVRAEVRGFVVP
jgi:uncharacterized protein (TIGR02588 family)